MGMILEILMRREGMYQCEAQLLIEEAKEQLQKYLADGDMESAENICQEFFGLEPDYIMELI